MVQFFSTQVELEQLYGQENLATGEHYARRTTLDSNIHGRHIDERQNVA